MPSISPVSRERHAAKRWLRVQSYDFAKNDAIAPLVMVELPKAMHSFPIGFVKQVDGFLPAAVLSLEQGRNLYIGPDGKWIGGYVPASVRGYPFRIGETEDGGQLLCIDEESGLVTDGPEGEAFFDEDGSLSEEIKKVLDFLGQIYQNRAATLRLCQLLTDKKLIEPWTIRVRASDGEKDLQGLFRVNEAALNGLDTETFDEVRRAGALPMIYCQLLSMQHMELLGRLVQAHAQRAAMMAKATPKVPDLTQSLTTSENIDWSKFGI